MITDVWDQVDQEVTRVLEGMRKSGFLQLTGEGKYQCVTAQFDMDSPYLFFQSDKAHDNCHVYFDIFFMHFGIVPSYCQKNCWKIVIKNRNFAEFWQNYTNLEDKGFYGKGGHDPREYTGCFWPIFIYNHSPEEGKKNYAKVAEILGDWCGIRDIPMILKQGCTEMEMKVPTKHWRVTPNQLRLEKAVLERIEFGSPPVIHQPDWLRRHKIRQWVRNAHMIGDQSYKTVWDKPLFVEPVTYHEGLTG